MLRRHAGPGVDRLELGARVADVAHAPPRILVEQANEQTAKRLRCPGRQRRPVRLVLHHRRQCRYNIVTGKCAAAREHFVEHAPERPKVGALVDSPTSGLFRRHVGRSAENDARARGGRRGDGRGIRFGRGLPRTHYPRLDHLREAEVEHLHGAVGGDLDVGRFQIAMNNPLLVRGVEGVRDLLGDWECLVERDRSLCNTVRKR